MKRRSFLKIITGIIIAPLSFIPDVAPLPKWEDGFSTSTYPLNENEIDSYMLHIQLF